MKIALLTAAAVVASAAVALAVPAASAATTPLPAPVTATTPPSVTVTATTRLTNRPDGGDAADWATDTIRRHLVVTETGPDANPALGFDFTATVTDAGRFATIPGALTPDQMGSYAGDTITGHVSGPLQGSDHFTFAATELPQEGLVPSHEDGAPVTLPQTTSFWYEQAFPAGTTFANSTEGPWGWTYTGPTCLSFRWRYGHLRITLVPQKWVDSSTVETGNITGRCSLVFV
jgi:hypothetical protein